ncbi:MAG: peptidase [Sulfuricurvum sp.]
MPKRSKKEIIARMNDIGVVHRSCGLGVCPRAKTDPAQIDTEKRMIPFILVSKNNAGERHDFWDDEVYIEELSPNGARLEELMTFFKDHHPSVDTAIGRIDNARVEDEMIKSDVYFGTDEDASKVFQKYRDGVLTDVSIGYYVHDVIITSRQGEPDHVLVTDYTIVELSAVWKGFDRGATIGRSFGNPKGEAETLLNTDLLRRKLNLKNKETR